MTNNGMSHWGSIEAGKDLHAELPLRTKIETELAETRLFVDQVYREYMNSGSRSTTDRMVKRYDDLPWFQVNHTFRD